MILPDAQACTVRTSKPNGKEMNGQTFWTAFISSKDSEVTV